MNRRLGPVQFVRQVIDRLLQLFVLGQVLSNFLRPNSALRLLCPPLVRCS